MTFGARKGTSMSGAFGSKMSGQGSSMSRLSGATTFAAGGAARNNVSYVHDSMLEDISGDVFSIKQVLNDQIDIQTKIQKNAYDSSLKNVRFIVMEEALEWVKKQSVTISKHLTNEHHKLIEKMLDYKERTQKQLDLLDLYQAQFDSFERRMALENSSKEAMYALDATNPLSLYDCLVPELEAHRPLKLPNFNFKKIVHDNN